jgi:hypothetical protein
MVIDANMLKRLESRIGRRGSHQRRAPQSIAPRAFRFIRHKFLGRSAQDVNGYSVIRASHTWHFYFLLDQQFGNSMSNDPFADVERLEPS